MACEAPWLCVQVTPPTSPADMTEPLTPLLPLEPLAYPWTHVCCHLLLLCLEISLQRPRTSSALCSDVSHQGGGPLPAALGPSHPLPPEV